jgi:serine/threonine-protein kinase
MIGESLGGYRITRKIGEGGMGVVYEAEHLMIGRRAAIKCLLPELSANAEACGRFFIEARAAALISHPSLVDIYDSGHTEGGSAYIIMEFLDGEDLGTALRRDTKIKLPTTLAIARQVASALGAVHQKGIVHRDLKPDNLFLVKNPGPSGEYRVKVLDFGIAKLTGPENKDLSVKTRTGSVLGTPSYMSPEQCRGHGKVDWRSDIYSLGCIMHEMLVGHPPFRGSGYGEVLAQHIYEQPPPLRTLDATIPDAVEQAVLRMLVKNPEQRLQTMDELGGIIDAFVQTSVPPHSPKPTPPPQVAPNFAQTVPAAQPAPRLPAPQPERTTLRGTASQKVPKPPGKRSKVGILAVVGGLAVAIGAVAIAMGGGGSGDQPNVASLPTATPDKKPDEPPPTPPPATDPKPAEPPKPAETAKPAETPTEPPKPTETAKPAEPPKPVETPPVPAPAKVHVALASEPPGAEIWKSDGTRIGSTPYAIDLDPQPGKVAYVVKMKGFKDQTVQIPGDKGGSETLKLVAEPKAPQTPPPAPGTGLKTTPKKGRPVKDGVVNPFAR